MRPAARRLRVSDAPLRRSFSAPGHREVGDACSSPPVPVPQMDRRRLPGRRMCARPRRRDRGRRDQPSVNVGEAASARPCRLVITRTLRPSVQLAWAHSPTFPPQCTHLAKAGTIVFVQVVSSVQIRRQAQSVIGVTEDAPRSRACSCGRALTPWRPSRTSSSTSWNISRVWITAAREPCCPTIRTKPTVPWTRGRVSRARFARAGARSADQASPRLYSL
jgi:hypothetical protein